MYRLLVKLMAIAAFAEFGMNVDGSRTAIRGSA